MVLEEAIRVAEVGTKAVDVEIGAHQVEDMVATATTIPATAADTLDHHQDGCRLHLARPASGLVFLLHPRRRRCTATVEDMEATGAATPNHTAIMAATVRRRLLHLMEDNTTAAVVAAGTKTRATASHHPQVAISTAEEDMVATEAMTEVDTVTIEAMEMAVETIDAEWWLTVVFYFQS